LTVERHFTGFLLVTHDSGFVTGRGNAGQAEDFHRQGRTRFLDLATQLVTHGTDTTIFQAAQHDVALTQGTFLYQHGSNRTTTLVQEGLDHDAVGHAVNHRFQLQYFGLDQDGFQQVIDALRHPSLRT